MQFLRGAGYSTLAIDFQAHGESTGDQITMGQLESLDARSALKWLRARLPGEPLRCLGYRWAAQRRLSDNRSRPTP